MMISHSGIINSLSTFFSETEGKPDVRGSSREAVGTEQWYHPDHFITHERSLILPEGRLFLMDGAIYMNLKVSIIILIIVGALFITGGTAAKVGGDRGWYEFHCDADGSKVYLDSEYVGDILNGMLSVPVYTTGAPYATYTVTYDACGLYSSITQNLPGIPAKGQTIDIYVDIEPAPCPAPTRKPIGGDMGYYLVWSNEDGVTIEMDGEDKGMTMNGYLQIQVYTTGTPYKTMTASKPGYIPITEEITEYPGAGETVDLYVTMNPDIIVAASETG